MSLNVPFVVALALVGVGLVGGTLADEAPERRVVERGGYRVLEADFHVHTRLSDGFLSPIDVVIQAQRRGLDAIAVTEHNGVVAAEMARAFSERFGGPTVLIGEEITTSRFHLIGVGLTETVSWNQTIAESIADIQAQGGVAIAAHPVGRFHEIYEPVLAELDGTELMHPLAYNPRGIDDRGGWRWEEMRDFYERARAAGHELAAIGSSDYHFFSPLGVCRTLVFARDDSPEAIMEALREARTVVRDLEGRYYGPPELVGLLEAEPYPWRPQDYNYAGSGVADRVTRTLGWVGLIGMVVVAPRRRSKEQETGNRTSTPGDG